MNTDHLKNSTQRLQMLEEPQKCSNHVYNLEIQLQQQRLQQALELKQLEYKPQKEECAFKRKLQIKDLQVRRRYAKQKLYEIINKSTRAIDNNRRKADIQEIYAALTETFDHFHRVHEECHGLLDDEEDIEESQVYFEYIQKVFTETKGKIDNFMHMKDLKMKCCSAKHKRFEIITKFSTAQENQRSNTNILEIDAELNEAFGHFHKVHDEYHGLLDDEEDIEESQIYFEYIQKGFKETKGKLDDFICRENKDQAGCSLDHSGASKGWVITSEATAEQSIVKSMTPKPNATNSTTTELITDKSTDAKPTTIKSTTIEQTSVRTSSSEPIITKMTTIERTTVVPTSAELPIVSSMTPKPNATNSTTTELITDESTDAKPTTIKSTTVEQTSVRTSSSEPIINKMTTIELTTVVPTSAELPIVSLTTPKPIIAERITTEPMFDESAPIEESNKESTSFELRTFLTTSEPTITKITTFNPITIGLTTEPTTRESTTSKSIATNACQRN